MVQISEIKYSNWGKCVKLTNGSIELFVTVDFGPRVIRFSKVGGENVMFEDIDDAINQYENEELFKEKFGADKGVWHIRGGHRLWTSPEYLPRTYYPDNEPVDYKITENGVILTPPEQAWTHFQYEIGISMSEAEDKIFLSHKITNKAPFANEFAPWALTVLAQGGKEIVPQNTTDTGLLGNRLVALWPYTKLSDERFFLGDKYMTLKQNPDAKTPFKIGLDSEKGWAAYLIWGDMFLKRFDVIQKGKTYADGGMNFETYTSKDFLEMESLGELKIVQPEESLTLSESWEYIKDVPPCADSDEEIDKLVKKYID